jgi:hypothetical protein
VRHEEESNTLPHQTIMQMWLRFDGIEWQVPRFLMVPNDKWSPMSKLGPMIPISWVHGLMASMIKLQVPGKITIMPGGARNLWIGTQRHV